MFSVEAQKTYTKKLYKNDNVDSPLMIEPPQLELIELAAPVNIARVILFQIYSLAIVNIIGWWLSSLSYVNVLVSCTRLTQCALKLTIYSKPFFKKFFFL